MLTLPYKNDRGSTTLHYDDRDYTLKYARSSNGSLHGGVSHELVPENSLSKLKTDSSRAEDDPGFYTVLKQHGHLSTCTPPPSLRVTRSRVVRRSPSLTTRVP